MQKALADDVVVRGSLIARWISADNSYEYVVIEKKIIKENVEPQAAGLGTSARRDVHGGQEIRLTENPDAGSSSSSQVLVPCIKGCGVDVNPLGKKKHNIPICNPCWAAADKVEQDRLYDQYNPPTVTSTSSTPIVQEQQPELVPAKRSKRHQNDLD